MQTCAAQHPDVPRYEYNVRTKLYEGFTFPNENLRTEYWGARQNRQYLYSFIQAGFDLLTMQKNFVGWTAYNEPGQKSSPAKSYNIKAAILLADFAGGIGYVNGPDFRWGRYGEAIFRMERNTMLQPTAEILANIDQWPAMFFGKGLWDNYQSAAGTYEAYRRVKELKKLVFVRGPHGAGQWGAENIAYMIDKMTEFAVRVVVNTGKKYSEVQSFKEVVLSSPPYWEPSSRSGGR